MSSTNLISGLATGFDWRAMIDQLIAVEYRKVDLVSNRKTDYQNKLTAWQDLNTKLLAFKTSAASLRTTSSFNLLSTSLSSSSTTTATDILTATAGTAAVPGTYSIEVLQSATSQKVSSQSFTSQNTALGASYASSFLINGRVVTIAATDTLVNVRDKINDLNNGTNATNVTASILSFSSTDYRLVLTSQTEGSEGMGLQQVSSENVLQVFGFITASSSIKHATSDGAKSDTLTSAGTAISTLLSLSSAPTGDVTIGGQALTVDLSKTLTQIASDIDALAGVSAQVVSSTVNGSTVYQIDISGTTSFTDANNVLQTLGILRGTYGSVQEIHTSDTANTKTSAAGGGYVTAATKWGEINTGSDSNNVVNGDTIIVIGTKHDRTAVSQTYTINDKNSDTIQGFLTQIETWFGLDAGSATITAAGKIQVTDSTAGDSALTITLNAQNEGGGDINLGTLTATQQGYSMELQSGLDAQLKVDGNYGNSTSNTVTDAISGVTLNLKKAEVGTTITLNVSRDIDGITSKINELVAKYNAVMSFIHTQSSYDSENQQPGGVLFADGTLKSVKSDLMNILVAPVQGVSSEFSILGLIGINLDNEGQLTVNETTLKGYLRTNYEDVKRLFIANGTTTIGTLRYSTHGLNTNSGIYKVNIARAATAGSIAGTTDLSGGLGGDQTLTIQIGSASGSVSLTNGMSLSEIVNAINNELDEEYAEVIVGDEVLYADAAMTSKITNSTVWANVYDDTGTSAGIQNNDVIRFSGTTRDGTPVSDSYTISNINTDTVQGLLSAIETAYSNTVIASINSDGKITLTDKTTGTSSISLTVSNPTGRNLNFGTIDVDATGADGSREGRYAIPVTASASADSKYLVLTRDNYGSLSFTVSQDTSDNNYYQILYTTTSSTTSLSTGAIYITADTDWSDIYGADLKVGDKINISGFARDGVTPVSGSYTINSLTDHISGLLTAIEGAYSAQGTTVDAFVRDGAIYVEDTTATGSSSIALTLTPSYDGGGSGLTLGTFDLSTERHLDLGLINGAVTGLDVAGTINGEAATGSGQTLTGDDGEANIDGLVVSYTGTSAGNVGSVTLTLGVAEAFYRKLFYIADAYEGYASFKQTSLQTRIDSVETQIKQMETRLDRKMQTMINRFVIMERTIGQLQNQSTWLASQINGLFGSK